VQSDKFVVKLKRHSSNRSGWAASKSFYWLVSEQ